MNGAEKGKPAAWLLLVFTLPTAKASARVGVWRKLQRYGALALPASGYVLPNNSTNQERFEWLATSIRSSKGQAAVAQVYSFDELRNEQIEHMFTESRTREYRDLEKQLLRLAKGQKGDKAHAGVSRLKRRFQQIVDVDFFGSPARARVEHLWRQLESGDGAAATLGKNHVKDYLGRTWVTRPQPGVDRVASAWLIVHYIDPQAKFAFAKDPRRHPDAVPFDMFSSSNGFGHVGNDCTFETLVKSFAIKDPRLRIVAQAVHDADLADEHFGRSEALGIDRILEGWNRKGLSNEEVLSRGMEMIEGLYNGIR